MRKHAKATLAKHELLEAILWETFFDMVRIVIRMDCRRFRGENEAVKSSSAIERADSLLVSCMHQQSLQGIADPYPKVSDQQSEFNLFFGHP